MYTVVQRRIVVTERKSPGGVRGEGPVESLGDKVPHKLNQFTDIVYRFWLQKLSIFFLNRIIHLLILDQYLSRWG